MKLYIDDLRDPKRELGEERADGMVWIKEWWEARNFLFDNEAELTEIHFDHYLGGTHTAGDLFQHVAVRKIHADEYPKLTNIYLHSSDSGIVKNYIERYAERLAKVGVTLHDNSKG